VVFTLSEIVEGPRFIKVFVRQIDKNIEPNITNPELRPIRMTKMLVALDWNITNKNAAANKL
jgi:hypothetical protein